MLVHSPVVTTGQSTTLKSHWSGPYVITKKINDVNLIVQNSNNGKKSIVHYDRIKHNNIYKEKRISLPKKCQHIKELHFLKKTCEQPSVEYVEIQSDDNDLLLFEPDENVVLIEICFVDVQLKWQGHQGFLLFALMLRARIYMLLVATFAMSVSNGNTD